MFRSQYEVSVPVEASEEISFGLHIYIEQLKKKKKRREKNAGGPPCCPPVSQTQSAAMKLRAIKLPATHSLLIVPYISPLGSTSINSLASRVRVSPAPVHPLCTHSVAKIATSAPLAPHLHPPWPVSYPYQNPVLVVLS